MLKSDQLDICNDFSCVFYSALPRSEGEIRWNLYWWARKEFSDEWFATSFCPGEYMRSTKPFSVAEHLESDSLMAPLFSTSTLDVKTPGKPILEFTPYQSFHRNIETYEIYTHIGLFPILEQDLQLDGVGFAGLIRLVPTPTLWKIDPRLREEADARRRRRVERYGGRWRCDGDPERGAFWTWTND